MAHFVQRIRPGHRYEGFQSMDELVHPSLRPEPYVNSVKKLLEYKFQKLEEKIDEYVARHGVVDVYFPWTRDKTGWAFALFKPCQEVRKYLTNQVIRLYQKFKQSPTVHIHANVYDGTPRTDYKYLVQVRTNLLVFGDNASGVGKGNAAAIRDEPNAFGIPTGWNDVASEWTHEMENRSVAAELATREHRLMAKEHELTRKEQGLKQKEMELNKREETLRKKELEVEGMRRKLQSQTRVATLNKLNY